MCLPAGMRTGYFLNKSTSRRRYSFSQLDLSHRIDERWSNEHQVTGKDRRYFHFVIVYSAEVLICWVCDLSRFTSLVCAVKCDRLQTCAKMEHKMHQCGQRWRWCSWSRHCATKRDFEGSIPDYVIGIFHWHNRTGHNVTLGSTQPVTQMCIKNISWGAKRGQCVGLTILPHL